LKIIRPITITDAMLTASNVAENDYAEYAAGTTYADGDHVIETAAGVHKIYESLQGANTGNALTDTAWWLDCGPTNRWKAFDQAVGSQTSQATSITFQLTPAQHFDSIAFLNMDAVTVQVVVTDPTAGVVHNQTVELLTTIVTGGADEVYDWYSYFFSEYFRKTDVVIYGIPIYLSAVVDITITYTGGTAKCGAVILGLQTNIGTTLQRPQIGFRDYSTIEADTFGVYNIVERECVRRMSCDVKVNALAVDNVLNILMYYKSKPVVWDANETATSYTSLMVYGFCRDRNIVASCPLYSMLNIEIEGFTNISS